MPNQSPCYHVWVARENNKGFVASLTLIRKCLSRPGANKKLATYPGAFVKGKAGLVLACWGDDCPCQSRKRGCDRAPDALTPATC